VLLRVPAQIFAFNDDADYDSASDDDDSDVVAVAHVD
jgi:hypothetical protein